MRIWHVLDRKVSDYKDLGNHLLHQCPQLMNHRERARALTPTHTHTHRRARSCVCNAQIFLCSVSILTIKHCFPLRYAPQLTSSYIIQKILGKNVMIIWQTDCSWWNLIGNIASGSGIKSGSSSLLWSEVWIQMYLCSGTNLRSRKGIKSV